MEADSCNFLKENQACGLTQINRRGGGRMVRSLANSWWNDAELLQILSSLQSPHSQHYVSYFLMVGISLCWSHKETVARQIMPGSGTRQQGINLLPHCGSWHNTLPNAATTLLVYCVFSVRPYSGFMSTQCSFEQQEDLDALTLQPGCLPINNPLSVWLYIKSVWLSRYLQIFTENPWST